MNFGILKKENKLSWIPWVPFNMWTECVDINEYSSVFKWSSVFLFLNKRYLFKILIDIECILNWILNTSWVVICLFLMEKISLTIFSYCTKRLNAISFLRKSKFATKHLKTICKNSQMYKNHKWQNLLYWIETNSF